MKPRRTLTPAQMIKAQRHLSDLVRIAGSVVELSADAGVSQQQIYNCIRKGYISATIANTLCKQNKYSRFTREELCPDVKVWTVN